jgi:hypothetical protein
VGAYDGISGFIRKREILALTYNVMPSALLSATEELLPGDEQMLTHACRHHSLQNYGSNKLLFFSITLSQTFYYSD